LAFVAHGRHHRKIKLRLLQTNLSERRNEHVPKYTAYRIATDEYYQKLQQKMEMLQLLQINEQKTNQSVSVGTDDKAAKSGEIKNAGRGFAGNKRSNAKSVFKSNLPPVNPLAQDSELTTMNIPLNPKTGYPTVMSFKVLPSSDEIISLIEKGFMEATSVRLTTNSEKIKAETTTKSKK
jgi:hypothetical protein